MRIHEHIWTKKKNLLIYWRQTFGFLKCKSNHVNTILRCYKLKHQQLLLFFCEVKQIKWWYTYSKLKFDKYMYFPSKASHKLKHSVKGNFFLSGGLRLPKFLEKMWWRGRKDSTQKLRCTCTKRWLMAGSWRRSSTLSMKTSSTCQASNSQKMWFVDWFLYVWHEQYVGLISRCLTWTVCEVDISVYLIQTITFQM